ncbi:hypothetical protein [Nodosilinea sp. FACHB-13]|uniref:CAP domain-containing protein n=1 Tax=Cyanophyceae TaxID=3028117 RepID=UPI001686B635|nr:hypothetical protein [Nodosilinea sp. FACHB-13]MBD2110029.1 hypothetical protein [Nodosilinea sp. FACHB-13]
MSKYRSSRAVSRRHPTAQHHWAVVLSALVFGSYALVQTHQLFFQSNGAGDPGWAIGHPQAQWNFRLGNQPLPELRALALEVVNHDRLTNALPPLVEDPLLSQVAQKHAEDMLARQFTTTLTPTVKTPQPVL